MAFIDLGKLKFNWQGTWNNSTAYEVDDVVFHNNQAWVATADVATGQAEPQANTSWSLMAAGMNYRGSYASGTTYYLHDMVTYGSSLYMLTGITETGSQTGVDPGSNPGSDNWTELTPAPVANVLHTIGDMIIRNNANQNARLQVVEQVGKGLTVQEAPLETYPSRAFTYELNGTSGNVINTPGSIAAVTYNITTKNQRSNNYVIDGSDKDGDINWEYDGQIRVNIGDTIVFNNTVTQAAHPMAIRVADGGASVTTGTYSGEGTATVTWDTTGVTAGTYYYQCTNHAGMVGQIIVEETVNRQGSSGANGTMMVCRGKTYTITLNNVTSGLSYNLFNASAPQAGTTNAITTDEGNSAPSGTSYSGSPVTFTFTPNETTPDTVYLSSASNTDDQVEITVNDLAYVPSWGTASATAGGAGDLREFKHWQDWYGGDVANDATASSHGTLTINHTRNPGDDVTVSDVAVGQQQRRIPRSGSGGGTVSWTVPDGVEKIRITCVGGGGGGGNYSGNYYGGAGGGGGAFTSSEYTVEAGDVLNVVAGIGGHGSWGTTGASGTTSSVMSNDGGVKISISAEGGGGGYYSSVHGKGGNYCLVSGTSAVAGTSIQSAGGHGGYGSPYGLAWTYVHYPSGGGGSAGSMYGNGFPGGDGYQTNFAGRKCGQPGGGGIGGTGGTPSVNYQNGQYGGAAGGGGGGSAGPGQNGVQRPRNSNGYYYGLDVGGDGGAGLVNFVDIEGYRDHAPRVHGVDCQSNTRPNSYYPSGSSSTNTELGSNDRHDHKSLQNGGRRYGDGEAASPLNGFYADHSTMSVYSVSPYKSGKVMQTSQLDRAAKSFNGVLGRLWGGGGAGASVNNDYYSSNGGEGGAGAGGGGGVGYYTSGWGNTSNNRGQNAEMSVWDPGNLAFRVHDKFKTMTSQTGLYNSGGAGAVFKTWFDAAGNGNGGHGGALGGGGGGGNYQRQGGFGGIGGGGGGASGGYPSSNWKGTGGCGGPGYVLIEWK